MSGSEQPGGLLTSAEVAEWLQIPWEDFLDWHRTPGRAPRHVHVGDRIRYRAADLDGWVGGVTATFLDACEQCSGEVQFARIGQGHSGRLVVADNVEVDVVALSASPGLDASGL